MINAKLKKTILATPIVSYAYKFIRELYKKCCRYRKCALLRKYGPYIICNVHEALTKCNLSYFANFGTLLGIVRDNGFIRHDDDVDYSIVDPHKNASLYCRALLEIKGFVFKRAFEFRGAIKQLVFNYNGVDVDFFFMQKEGSTLYSQAYGRIASEQYASENEWSTSRYVSPDIKGIKTVPFAGSVVSIPINAEEVLTAAYGCWKTPIKNFGGPQWERDFGQAKRFILSEKALVVGLDRVWELA